jgi:hypothetical protein
MVRRMLRKGSVVAFSALALLVAGCGPGVRAQGSAAIAGFLHTVQADDGEAFEAGIDRPALRADLREQLAALGKSRGVDVGGASEFALDRMITPQAVRLTAARVGPGWPATPTAAQVVPHMQVADRGHVCLEEAASHRCLLAFARRDGAWRLVGMRFTPPPSEAAPGEP